MCFELPSNINTMAIPPKKIKCTYRRIAGIKSPLQKILTQCTFYFSQSALLFSKMLLYAHDLLSIFV